MHPSEEISFNSLSQPACLLPSSIDTRHRVEAYSQNDNSGRWSLHSTADSFSDTQEYKQSLILDSWSYPDKGQAVFPDSYNFPESAAFNEVDNKIQTIPYAQPECVDSMPCLSAQWSDYIPQSLSPYDICELHVYSLHELEDQRECLRILGVAAGETLHNIYRIIMTSLKHREDRARLVFHSWILPDGRIYGYGPRFRHVIKDKASDREISLKDLPLRIGYQLGFVFGKCVYAVIVHDILLGLTNENDMIWMPRICEGSYGEPIPFDLCYSPHLFVFNSELSNEELQKLYMGSEAVPLSAEEDALQSDAQIDAPPKSEAFKAAAQDLRPKHSRDRYLSNAELDEMN